MDSALLFHVIHHFSMLLNSLRRALTPFLSSRSPAPESAWADTGLETHKAALDAMPVPEAPWLSEAQGKFNPLRRSIIAILPRQPFVDWLRTRPDEKDATLKYAREHDSISFLIPYPMNSHETVRVVPDHWPRFFTQMLEQACDNPGDWPAGRTWEMFQQWFEIEYRDTVLDIADAMAAAGMAVVPDDALPHQWNRQGTKTSESGRSAERWRTQAA
jgi:hypothetical protein